MILQRVRRFMVKSRLFMESVNLLLRMKNKKAQKIDVVTKYKADIFDFKTLSKPSPYFPNDYVFDNHMYGITSVLKEYLSIDKALLAYIEHGMFLGTHLQFDQDSWFVPQIVTLSPLRAKHLRSKGIKKDIIPIGPYIHYAKSLLDDSEHEITKRQLGKTLLVFPPHSTKTRKSIYELDSLLSHVEGVKGQFDTVIFCLYWLDCYDDDLVEKIESRNYLICTAGHKYDQMFLRRLRTFIELSDFTLSASAGTHVGYCTHLGKPHQIFRADLSYVERKSGTDVLFVENPLFTVYSEEIYKAFENWEPLITEQQRQIVDKHWGTSKIRDKEELKHLLRFCK